MAETMSHPALYAWQGHDPDFSKDHFVPEGWEDLDLGLCPRGEAVRWDADRDHWVVDRTLRVVVVRQEERDLVSAFGYQLDLQDDIERRRREEDK
jgi:hypothetical protein